MGDAVSWRPVPSSLPEPVGWPPVGPSPGGLSPGEPSPAVTLDQPPLPWSPTAGAEAPTSGRDRRVVRYGADWAPAWPDRLPDAGLWADWLAGALLETLQGRRPVAQLNRWLDTNTLARLTVLLRRPLGPAVLSRVLVGPGSERAVEVVAVSRSPLPGNAAVAVLAFRMQVFGSRWLCRALEVLPVSRPAGSRFGPAPAGYRGRGRRADASAPRRAAGSRSR